MCFQSALSCVRRAPHKPAPRSPQPSSTQKSSPLRSCTSLSSRRTGFMAIAQAYSLSIFDRDAYPSTMGTVCYKPHIATFDQLFSHQKRPLPTQLTLIKEACIFRMCSGQDSWAFLFMYFYPGGQRIFHTHTHTHTHIYIQYIYIYIYIYKIIYMFGLVINKDHWA